MKTGDLVEAIDFRGRIIVRKVVEISDEIVYICSLEEYDLALRMGKEPISVGFNREFVQPCHGK